MLPVRSESVRNRGTTDIEMPARTEEEHLQRGVATVRNKLGIILQRKLRDKTLSDIGIGCQVNE